MAKDFQKIEEMFYTYGDVCKNIGKIETDGKDENDKRYDKLCKEREQLMKDFDAEIKALKAGKT
jgi:hypothetical protein